MAPFISILGLFDAEYPAHVSTRESIIHAEKELGVVMNTRWITPEQLRDGMDCLEGACAALIAPRNPRTPRQLWPEILDALEWLRNRRIPTLGIEYGYQHMVIELARNVLGHELANSTAYDESTDFPVINKLFDDVPFVDRFSPEVIEVEVSDGSGLADLYGHAGVVRESFRGHFVMNPDYAPEFEAAGFRFPVRGQVGDRPFIAGLEWNALPFYTGVAYLPQAASAPDHCHPVIKGLLAAGLAG